MGFFDEQSNGPELFKSESGSSKPVNGYDEVKKSFTGQPSNTQLMDEQLKTIKKEIFYTGADIPTDISGGDKSPSKLPIPLGDRVLVTKTKPEEKSAGGIIIPQMAIEDAKTGFVVATGPLVGKTTRDGGAGEYLKAIISKGDFIQYGEYCGTEVKAGGETYLVMREADILCILP